MANVVPTLLVFSLLAAAGAGAVLRPVDDAAGLDRIEGTVVEVGWNPHWDVAVEYTVAVDDVDGTTFFVEVGPPWWWAQVELPQVEVDDALAVEGIIHEGNLLEAYTFAVNGGSAVVLREDGKPLWAEVASGRPQEDGP